MPELEQRIADLERRVNEFQQIDKYFFSKDLRIFQGRKIKGGIYAGDIASDGTLINLPTGWTSAKTALGKYTITHGLGLTNYAVITSPSANLAAESDVNSRTSTTFKIEMLLGGGFADSGFTFILMLY